MKADKWKWLLQARKQQQQQQDVAFEAVCCYRFNYSVVRVIVRVVKVAAELSAN